MNDFKLTLRKEHYSLKFNQKLPFAANDDYQLSLRKNKLFASLMSKRSVKSGRKDRPITFEEITTEIQIDKQIMLLKEYLYHGKLHAFTEEQIYYLTVQLLPKFTQCIFDSNTQLLLKESIVLIFIDMFDSFTSYLIDVIILCQLQNEISSALNYNRKYHNLLLVLLSNLLCNTEEIHQIITNTINIPSIIKSAYNEGKLDGESKKILFVLVKNFICYYDCDDKGKYIHIATDIIVPEIKQSFSSMDSVLFFQGIDTLNSYVDCDALISIVICDKILLNILTELLMTADNQSSVIEIFCTILSGSEEQNNHILNEHIVKSLNNIITAYAFKVRNEGLTYDGKRKLFGGEGQMLIYSIRALSNIACCGNIPLYNQMILNKEFMLIDSMIDCFKHSNSQDIRTEIINFLIKGMNSNNKLLHDAFITVYKIHEVFGIILLDLFSNPNSNEDQINDLLDLIESILVCSINSNYYLNIKNQLQQLDFVDNLTRIQLNSTNNLICSRIEDLLSIHWNENEIYYNVCNEYMNVR